jgi:two-component system chemotaxis response regulator CheB
VKTLRVLIVDDSAYNRRTLAEIMMSLPGVDVVGKATDGDDALRMAEELKPDLITLDLEMPRMDGFTFLRLLMARRPTPVIVVSGYSAKENVFRALELGALDFVAKPTRAVAADLTVIREELAEKVEMVRYLSPAGYDPRHGRPSLQPGRTATQVFRTLTPPAPGPQPADVTGPPRRVVVVGASTGGPTALLELFGQFPPRAAASIVVAQHMPERFTQTFAERLNRLGALEVAEASEIHRVESGMGFICPGGRCIELLRTAGGLAVRVAAPDERDRYVPSVDRLFESAAEACGERLVAVVLTGMGDDGARGVVAVKRAGGTVLAEAPETAVIYGMPGAAVRTGCVDKSLPLRDLALTVARVVQT